MATSREIRVRIIPLPRGSYAQAISESPLAAGFDDAARERGLLRLRVALAEQARDEAEADAAAWKATAKSAQVRASVWKFLHAMAKSGRRADRLKLNETETLLNAARCIGRDQLKEIGELRGALTASHADYDEASNLIDRVLGACNPHPGRGGYCRHCSELRSDLAEYVRRNA